MAGTTTRGAFPYPTSTDPDDVPADLQRLAQKIADTVALSSDLAAVAPVDLQRHLLMTPGATVPGIKRTEPVNLAVGANTVLTVPAGRKYVVKNLVAGGYANGGVAFKGGWFIPGLASIERLRTYSPGVPVHLNTAIVMNAGEQLKFDSDSTQGTVMATYADLPAADAATRLAVATGFQSTAWVTQYTAPAGGALITSMTFCAAASRDVYYAVRFNSTEPNLTGGYQRLAVNETHYFDTPFALASGQTLQVISGDAATNGGANAGALLDFTINGITPAI